MKHDPDPERDQLLEWILHQSNKPRQLAAAWERLLTVPELAKLPKRRVYTKMKVCKRGHEMTEENTYRIRGERWCRECRRMHKREERARHKNNGPNENNPERP